MFNSELQGEPKLWVFPYMQSTVVSACSHLCYSHNPVAVIILLSPKIEVFLLVLDMKLRFGHQVNRGKWKFSAHSRVGGS